MTTVVVGAGTIGTAIAHDLPDTVPILSASARTKGLFYATGHGHLGLTYAATTARLMGELVTGTKPSLDLRPCRVDRF